MDVVQLFLDGGAVKAAIADGKSRDQAQYLTVWLRTRTRGCGPCRWPPT